MKERFLTVLVPIKDSDATTVAVLPAVNPNNINVIYKHNGVYKRVWKNPDTGQYEYHVVVDREFPYIGVPLIIDNFTYDATRMGSAPTISAQNVMWYAEKDQNGHDVTLDGLWTQDCHVSFGGENFYLKRVPTSGKDNEDARYKYDIDFVSERVVLENIYFYDVVQPYVNERPISESSTFSFYGGIEDFVKRLNSSLVKSGVSYFELRSGVSSSDVLTYDEWNDLGMGIYNGDKPVRRRGGQGATVWIYFYPYYQGDYSAYLRNEIYKYENNDFVMHGYKCMIGKDKIGQTCTSEEKLLSFENNTIHEALQQVHDELGLLYYISKEKDSNGNYTGDTVIMIADCEKDNADIVGHNSDGSPVYRRDGDSIPVSSSPIDYGVNKELLSKEKANTTEKIITRITGVGGSENIPWYYPNPTADGWISPFYEREEMITGFEIDYPIDEGSTPLQNARYEKYLKNRIGNDICYGRVEKAINQWGYADKAFDGWAEDSSYPENRFGRFRYIIDTNSIENPSIDLHFTMPESVVRFVVKLQDNTDNTEEEYDSTESYGEYTDFQKICAGEDSPEGENIQNGNYLLTSGHIYYLVFYIWLETPTAPPSNRYDAKGYLYPSNSYVIPLQNYTFYIRQDFYDDSDLTEGQINLSPSIGEPAMYPNIFYKQKRLTKYYYYCGYCKDDSPVTPMTRKVGARYMDITIDTLTGLPKNKVYVCTSIDPTNTEPYQEIEEMDIYEWVETYFTLTLNIWSSGVWYINSSAVTLSDYGIELPGEDPVYVKDYIRFKRAKYLTPQKALMPELYIKTDGERRFYDAKNYPLSTASATVDPDAGEVVSGTRINNPIYYKDGTTTHYVFESEYRQSMPHEHIENFEDIVPSIKEQYNTVSGSSIRIDVVEEFAYDDTDNDEVWESNEDGNIEGEYKHPFLFAKLRPLGFNIFDLALQEDMVISMTTGNCGACNFKIGVDENTKKNPVQIWEYDVYGGYPYNNRGDMVYEAGSLRRYVDTTNLYYDTDGTSNGYVQVDSYNENYTGFLVSAGMASSRTRLFERTVYSSEKVTKGEVGSLKQDNKTHFEGDVKVNGKFIETQQDTSTNYVWVALYKDTDTYGTIMPSAKPNYEDRNYDTYIRPKSIQDVHTSSSTAAQDEENADKFVILNIRMPQVYLRRAERKLSEKLVGYMYDNNYERFNFSIDFSRIYLKSDATFDDELNENSVLYVNFNRGTYRQYVKHYTYTMVDNEPLPQIAVDMNEELFVTRTQKQTQAVALRRNNIITNMAIKKTVSSTEDRIKKTTVGKNDDVVITGNIISRTAVSSINELKKDSLVSSDSILGTQVDLEVNHFKRDDFTISNGTDLKIGDDLFLPTTYKSGGQMRKRVWDVHQQAFVENSTNDFSPAFIDTSEQRLVEYGSSGVKNSIIPARVVGNTIRYGATKSISPAFIDTTAGENNENVQSFEFVNIGGASAPVFETGKYYREFFGDMIPINTEPSDWQTNWNQYYKQSITKEVKTATRTRVSQVFSDINDAMNSLDTEINEFNNETTDKLNQITYTIERDVMPTIQNYVSGCTTYCRVKNHWSIQNAQGVYIDTKLWRDKTGESVLIPQSQGVCKEDSGAISIAWEDVSWSDINY